MLSEEATRSEAIERAAGTLDQVKGCCDLRPFRFSATGIRKRCHMRVQL